MDIVAEIEIDEKKILGFSTQHSTAQIQVHLSLHLVVWPGLPLARIGCCLSFNLSVETSESDLKYELKFETNV